MIANDSSLSKSTKDASGVYIDNDPTNSKGHILVNSKRSGMSIPEMLHHAGPDFMSNKFDVYFLWDPLEADTKTTSLDELTDQILLESSTAIEKYILNHRGFAVRSGKIEVPATFNQDFNIPFLETQINKIRSNKTQNNQSSITFRMDQDLVWLNEVQLLSGRLMTLDNAIMDQNEKVTYYKRIKETWDKEKDGTFPSISLRQNWQHLFRCIAKTWPTRSKGTSYNLKQTGLCLIVKMEHLANQLNLNYQQKILPYFIFENVRILGVGDSINYTRDDANIQEVKIEFIFKRSYELMPKVNVRNNDSGRDFEKTVNKDKADDDELWVPKTPRSSSWKIPIYDQEDHYSDVNEKNDHFFYTLNR